MEQSVALKTKPQGKKTPRTKGSDGRICIIHFSSTVEETITPAAEEAFLLPFFQRNHISGTKETHVLRCDRKLMIQWDTDTTECVTSSSPFYQRPGNTRSV